MSDNLAEQIFQPEPEEHDQALIYKIRLDGEWLDVVPGTMEVRFGDEDLSLPAVIFEVKTVLGATITGLLSEITGLKSLSAPETPEDEDGV